MRYFGPLFDRSIARKLEDKLGGQKTAVADTGSGPFRYEGTRGRIISEDVPVQAQPRYAVMFVVGSSYDTDASWLRFARSDVLKQKPYVTAKLTPVMWATGTDNGLTSTETAVIVDAVPVGNGDFVFRTFAYDAPNWITRFNLVNASPVLHDTRKTNTSVGVIDASSPLEGDPYGVFTGWLIDGTTHRQGFAAFVRGAVGAYDRAHCIHSQTGFSGWAQSEITTLADTHAAMPIVVCSAPRELSGVVLVTENSIVYRLQHIVSSDNGANWTATTVSGFDPIAYGYTFDDRGIGAAASDTHALFAMPFGQVIRHQAGTTSHTVITGQLPITAMKKLYHIGNGAFLCFAFNVGFTDNLVVSYRSLDNGSSWTAIDGTGVSQTIPEYCSAPLVVTPYVDSGSVGELAMITYDPADSKYKLRNSVDAGVTWEVLREYPAAVAPTVDTMFRVFGSVSMSPLYDLGAYRDVNAKNGVYNMLVGTDNSRPEALVEV